MLGERVEAYVFFFSLNKVLLEGMKLINFLKLTMFHIGGHIFCLTQIKHHLIRCSCGCGCVWDRELLLNS